MLAVEHTVLVELSVYPVGKGESLSAHVARAVDVIDRSGVPYRLGPMGTVIEGTYDQCMALIKQCFEAVAADSDRVVLSLKLDFRRGRTGALASKTESVSGRLGRKLCT